MPEKIIETHSFMLSENLRLETTFFDNGDDENFVYMNQKLTVEGKGGVDSASLNLYASTFGPTILRKLANELESALIRAKQSKGGTVRKPSVEIKTDLYGF